MAQDYETILREALELHATDRARLIDELARSLAREAGLDSEALIRPETSERLDANLREARRLEDARIEAVLDKARKRRESTD